MKKLSDFSEDEKEKMLVHQFSNFKTYIDRLENIYLRLCIKRIQTEDLSRDEYFLYDTFDALIHFISLCDEVVDKDKPFPGYCLEKVSRVKSYIDTLYSYYESKGDDNNG